MDDKPPNSNDKSNLSTQILENFYRCKVTDRTLISCQLMMAHPCSALEYLQKVLETRTDLCFSDAEKDIRNWELIGVKELP